MALFGVAIDPRVDIGHVHLKVADLDRALAFYRGVLGFEVQQRLRRPGGVRLGGRLPPPHRAEHVGVAGRLAAAARHDRPLPRRDPLSGPRDARRRAPARARRRHPARRRERPRRQRGDLPARPRRQRRRALPRPAARGVAAAGRRRRGVAMFTRPARRPGRCSTRIPSDGRCAQRDSTSSAAPRGSTTVDPPAASEGLVRVTAGALNPVDISIAHGRFYGGTPDCPYVIGSEAVGVTRGRRRALVCANAGRWPSTSSPDPVGAVRRPRRRHGRARARVRRRPG